MITTRTLSSVDLPTILDIHCTARQRCFDFLPDPHPYSNEQDIAFFNREILPKCKLFGAISADGALIGYLALSKGWIEHLYVHPDHHRKGAGKILLQQSQVNQPHLQLWVFQKNHQARTFYERNGFKLKSLHDGSTNEEKEPDAIYEWRRRGVKR
jgi:putative acetyltransferase